MTIAALRFGLHTQIIRDEPTVIQLKTIVEEKDADQYAYANLFPGDQVTLYSGFSAENRRDFAARWEVNSAERLSERSEFSVVSFLQHAIASANLKAEQKYRLVAGLLNKCLPQL